MRVLLAASEGTASGALTLRLTGACIPNDVATIEDTVAFLQAYDYDAVVLVADQNAAASLRRLRRDGVTLPVLVISPMDGAGRAALLDMGADDVVGPGCESAELAARVRAIVRRGRGHVSSDLQAGAAELRLGRMELVVHGRAVPLTPKEYAILELLFLRRGAVHAKAAIVNHVYGAGDGPALRTLDVIVCKLRKKLAACGAAELVATVWGSGLVLRDLPPLQPVADAAMVAVPADASSQPAGITPVNGVLALA